jgi:hypothetical protein
MVPERAWGSKAGQGTVVYVAAAGIAPAPWPPLAPCVLPAGRGSSACSGSLVAMVALVLEARVAVGLCGEAAVSDPTVHLPLACLPHAMSGWETSPA